MEPVRDEGKDKRKAILRETVRTKHSNLSFTRLEMQGNLIHEISCSREAFTEAGEVSRVNRDVEL